MTQEHEDTTSLLWIITTGNQGEKTNIKEVVDVFLTISVPFRVLLLSESTWRSAKEQDLDEVASQLHAYINLYCDFSMTPQKERLGWVRILPFSPIDTVRDLYFSRLSNKQKFEAENRALSPWYIYTLFQSIHGWSLDNWQRNPGRMDQLTDLVEQFETPVSNSTGMEMSENWALRAEIAEKESQIKKLLRSEIRYRSFFEDDITGDFLMDSNWRIIDCNTSFLKIFGFPAKDFALSFTFRDVFPEPEVLRILENDFSVTKHLEYYEIDLLRQDGQKVNVIANLVGNLGETGENDMIRGFLFDNTHRKSLEHQLRESQRMEGLGRLAGGIAHDFNNILTVINGYSELLISDTPPGQQIARDLGDILQAGRKAAELTSQLLAFSRRQLRTPQSININHLVQGMGSILNRLLRESIEIKMDLDPALPRVLIDAAQMEQVVMNLCLNGQDAMREQGVLTLRTRRVLLERSVYDGSELILPGVYAEFSAEDQGLGIPENVLPHIFEPFYTTKEPGKGTGLGLATVYGIVQQSGAHILVESTSQKGTIFRLLFPENINNEETSDSQSHTPVTTIPKKAKILLVEDEEMVREYTMKILERNGHLVQAFSSGNDLLEFYKLSKDSWDLLISDVVMPGKSGPDTVKILREHDCHIPVLYISGYPDDEIQRHGLETFGMNFLHKPFKSQDFLNKITEILQPKVN